MRSIIVIVYACLCMYPANSLAETKTKASAQKKSAAHSKPVLTIESADRLNTFRVEMIPLAGVKREYRLTLYKRSKKLSTKVIGEYEGLQIVSVASRIDWDSQTRKPASVKSASKTKCSKALILTTVFRKFDVCEEERAVAGQARYLLNLVHQQVKP